MISRSRRKCLALVTNPYVFMPLLILFIAICLVLFCAFLHRAISDSVNERLASIRTKARATKAKVEAERRAFLAEAQHIPLTRGEDRGPDDSPESWEVQVGNEDLAYPLQVNMPELVARLRRGESVAPQPINAPHHPYIVENADRCGERETVFLLLCIKSAPANAEARDVIRRTWGDEACWLGQPVRRVFLFGRSIDRDLETLIHHERRMFDDVVQLDFIDHYFNNTYKVMAGLEWAVTHCSRARFVYFVDDDYFVSPRNMVRYLRSVTPALLPRFIAGYVWRHASPVRSRRVKAMSKWLVGEGEYPWPVYPAYCSAGSFVVSQAVAADIALAMPYTRYLRFDDVFLGIVCHKLLLVPIHAERMYSDRPVLPAAETGLDRAISSHGYSRPRLIVEAWFRISGNRFCGR